jgi:hypothetical protein
VKALYLVNNEQHWLVITAKQNGVSKEDFLLWCKENQQQAGEMNADNKNV